MTNYQNVFRLVLFHILYLRRWFIKKQKIIGGSHKLGMSHQDHPLHTRKNNLRDDIAHRPQKFKGLAILYHHQDSNGLHPLHQDATNLHPLHQGSDVPHPHHRDAIAPHRLHPAYHHHHHLSLSFQKHQQY